MHKTLSASDLDCLIKIIAWKSLKMLNVSEKFILTWVFKLTLHLVLISSIEAHYYPIIIPFYGFILAACPIFYFFIYLFPKKCKKYSFVLRQGTLLSLCLFILYNVVSLIHVVFQHIRVFMAALVKACQPSQCSWSS